MPRIVTGNAPAGTPLPGSVGHAAEDAEERPFLQASRDVNESLQLAPISPSNAAREAPPLPRRKPPAPRQPNAQFLQPAPPEQDPIFESRGFSDDQTPRSETDVSYISPAPETARGELETWEEEDPVTLSRMEEYLAVQHGLKKSCRTLPLTVVMWISFSFLIFHHGQVQSSYDNAESIRHAMQTISVPAPNSTFRKVALGSVTDYADILRWVKDGLIPKVSLHQLPHGRIGESQDLVGIISLTQTRGVPKECKRLDPNLKIFYPGLCHPPGGDPPSFGTDEMDYAFVPKKGTKNKFKAWLDIGRARSTLDERIDTLESGNWLDLDTQDVTVEAVFFNRDMNVYSHLQIIFTVDRGGWIEQDLIVKPMRGDVYFSWGLIFLDVIWIMVMAFFIWTVGKEVVQEYHDGTLRLYLWDLYSWLDWACIFFGLGIALFFYYLTVRLDTFSDNVKALGSMPQWAVTEAPMHYRTRAVLENLRFQNRVQDIIDEFVRLNTLTTYHRLSAFWYSFLVVARFFRGFTGQPRIALLLQTVMSAMDFLMHYLLVFVVMMASFTVGGYIVFGEQLMHWSTLGTATASAFLVIFGRFEYNEFHSVAPITAACWFFVFFISTSLILLGILTAAILNQYLYVRTMLGEQGETIVQQARALLREAMYSRSYEGSRKTMPEAVLFNRISDARETDPLRLRKMGRLRIDRRLRTSDDVHSAAHDPPVTEELLVDRGCDRLTAARLIARCGESGRKVDTLSSPPHRLTVLLAKTMSQLRKQADRLRRRASQQITWSSKAMDRLDLKHAKCVALARRVRRAQELPPGWSAHFDEQGRRYLRNDESGLTSWTLPRHLI